MHRTVEVYEGSGPQPFRWREVASNGQVTEGPQEGYATASNARRAALRHIEKQADPNGIIYKDHTKK